MIIVNYRSSSGPAYGLLEDSTVYTLAGKDPFGPLQKGAGVGRLEALELLPPVRPGKIIALGRNYAEHAKEHNAEVPTQPLLFLKAPSSVIGPGHPIVLTPLSQQVEYEAELAVVIGRRCKAVAEAEAWRVVLGVTCANDVTARDLQRSDGQWTRSKSFDTFCPLGPYIVTHLSPDQLGHLDVICRVERGQAEAQVRQHGNTADMIFKIPALIAYITAVMTLEPGDVILTGTPAGVGPLESGDRVEIEVEQVGVLSNPAIESVQLSWK
jgi:2-keto-4-pentenoate hydratase/2-oxohepta-3-ene-1,7-dioic acid hydratase in catechol pathway